MVRRALGQHIKSRLRARVVARSCLRRRIRQRLSTLQSCRARRRVAGTVSSVSDACLALLSFFHAIVHLLDRTNN